MKFLKYIILLFTVAFQLSFIDGDKKNDLEKENLKGKVKTVYLTYYKVKRNIKDSVFNFRVIKKYNTIGNIIELNFYQNGDSLGIKKKYNYNSKNQLIEEYLYNKTGNLATKIIYKYNKKGYNIEEILLDSNGNIIHYNINKFNNKGRAVERREYSSDNVLGDITTYDYNVKAKTKIERINNPDSSLRFYRIYKFDDNNYCIEIASFNAMGKDKGKTVYKYDENYNEIEYIHYEIGNYIGSQLTTKYEEYDKRGNWIISSGFDAFNFKKSESLRQIEYYD